MRKVRLVLCATALLFTGLAATANTNSETFNPTKKISKQIQTILSDNAIDIGKKDEMARVLFRVNEAGEIELVRVTSSRKDITTFLNRKLDHKKLEVDEEAIGEVFVVNVRVTS